MLNNREEAIYAQGGGRDLKLDIYRPEGTENHHTALLLLHGGMWRFGDRSMMDIFGPELARLGFVAVAPEYRLLGEAPWPDQIRDVKAAIRWTRANAEALDIRSDRIAVQGFSAGAHLALLAGGTSDLPVFNLNEENMPVSDRVAAVVAFFPPIAFAVGNTPSGITPASVLLGESASEEDANLASPLSYISEKYPPTFLLHGTADQMVPFTNSIRIFEKLYEKGVFAELHLYPGHTHEFVRLPSMLFSVQSEVCLFLKRAVVDPETYIRENLEQNMFARKKT
jgi:acetyl esterase/lipase